MSAGRREADAIGGIELEGGDLVEEEWSRLVLDGSADEVEPTVVLGTGEVVTVEEVGDELLLVSTKEVELVVLLDTGGAVTASLEGRITSTSMIAVALLDGGRKSTDVPTVAARTEGLSASNREKILADVT